MAAKGILAHLNHNMYIGHFELVSIQTEGNMSNDYKNRKYKEQQYAVHLNQDVVHYLDHFTGTRYTLWKCDPVST